MALYFAMINGERQGPFRPDQLRDAGVGPDTYVWCKGMADWEQAADVADICRFFRQHIFNLMHPVPATQPDREERQENLETPDLRFGIRSAFPMPEDSPADLDRAPASMLAPAILTTLLCFPLTGFFAIYYSVLSRRAWDDAIHSESKNGSKLYTNEERMECKKKAHDYARQSKMWVGITFFLGFIFYAALCFN